MQGWNANEGWRNLLAAQRYQGQQMQQGISNLMQGVNQYRENKREKALYDEMADIANNGTREEQAAFEAKVGQNPQAFNQFQKILENQQTRGRRQTMKEGLALAQTGSPEAYNAFISQVADPEIRKIVNDERTRVQKGQIEQYVGRAFQEPDLNKRYGLIRQGYEDFRGNAYYPQAVEAATEMMAIDPANPFAGKNDSPDWIDYNNWQRLEAKYLESSDPKDKDRADAFGRKKGFLPSTQYSAQVQKDLKELTGNAQAARIKRGKVLDLARRFDQVKDTYRGGLQGRAQRWFNQSIGNADYRNELQTEAINIVNSDAIANLPKGPASDKDVALVLSGFPDPNTSTPEQIISYLGALERLTKVQEEYNSFAARYIGKNGWNGLNEAWYAHNEKKRKRNTPKHSKL